MCPQDQHVHTFVSSGSFCTHALNSASDFAQAHGGEPLIPFSGSFESKLFDMPDDEKAAYCTEVRCAARCHLSKLLCHNTGWQAFVSGFNRMITTEICGAPSWGN